MTEGSGAIGIAYQLAPKQKVCHYRGMKLPQVTAILKWCVECGTLAEVAPVIRFADGTVGGPCVRCWEKYHYGRFLHQTPEGLMPSFHDRRLPQ